MKTQTHRAVIRTAVRCGLLVPVLLEYALVVLGGNTPPTVTITSPTNNAIFHVPASFDFFDIVATASDAGGSVSQVEFFEGSTSLGIDTTIPYSARAAKLPGTYVLSAVATDDLGAKATNTITVIINSRPIVELIRPELFHFAEPATVTIEADVSDSDGTITQVDFRFTNTTQIATFTSPPYRMIVSNLIARAYRGDVIATDNRNAQTRRPFGFQVVTPVPVVLSAPQRLSATQFQFNYTVNPRLRYVIERSPNLTIWNRLSTNTANFTTQETFTDNAVSTNLNFYRVRRLPNPEP